VLSRSSQPVLENRHQFETVRPV